EPRPQVRHLAQRAGVGGGGRAPLPQGRALGGQQAAVEPGNPLRGFLAGAIEVGERGDVHDIARAAVSATGRAPLAIRSLQSIRPSAMCFSTVLPAMPSLWAIACCDNP